MPVARSADTTKKNHAPQTAMKYSWIQMVAATLSRFDLGVGGHYDTVIHPCILKGQPGFIYERGITELYPGLFNYLEKLAQRNHLKLQENRRIESIEFNAERREICSPVIGLGASIMLKQTAMGKSGIIPSPGNVLRGNHTLIDVKHIINIAAEVKQKGQHQLIDANSMIKIKGSEREKVNYYQACLKKNNRNKLYHYFEGQGFHALGYMCGEQFAVEVLLGGGPLNAPGIWGPLQRMSKDPVEFHLFMGPGTQNGFGILKSRYILDTFKNS